MKSKRKKTIIKKVIEFSKMIDLDILLLIHDKEMLKLYEYNSGTIENGPFTFYRAANVRNMALETRYHKLLTDDYYNKFVKPASYSDQEKHVQQRVSQ